MRGVQVPPATGDWLVGLGLVSALHPGPGPSAVSLAPDDAARFEAGTVSPAAGRDRPLPPAAPRPGCEGT